MSGRWSVISLLSFRIVFSHICDGQRIFPNNSIRINKNFHVSVHIFVTNFLMVCTEQEVNVYYHEIECFWLLGRYNVRFSFFSRCIQNLCCFKSPKFKKHYNREKGKWTLLGSGLHVVSIREWICSLFAVCGQFRAINNVWHRPWQWEKSMQLREKVPG